MNIKFKREHLMLVGALLSGIASGYTYATITMKRKYEVKYAAQTESYTRAMRKTVDLFKTAVDVPEDNEDALAEMEPLLFDRGYSYPEASAEVGTMFIDEVEFFTDISREKKFIDVLDDDGTLIFLMDGEVVEIEEFLGLDAQANLLAAKETSDTEDAEVYIRNNDTDVDYEVSFAMP